MKKTITTLLAIGLFSTISWGQTVNTNLTNFYSLPTDFSDYTFTQLSGSPTILTNPARINLTGTEKARLSNSYSFPNTYDSIIVSYFVDLNSGIGVAFYPNISGNPIHLTGFGPSIRLKQLTSNFSINMEFRSNNQGGQVKVTGLLIVGYKTNTTAVNDLSNNLETFKLSPNPSYGKIELSFSNIDFKNSEVKIFDLVGKEIYTSKQLFAAKTEIDLSNQAEGIYLIQVLKNGKLLKNEKVLIVK